MDPFIVPVIAIVTVGVVITLNTFGVALPRRLPQPGPKADSSLQEGELEDIRDALTHMSGRLERLEEERDFYKDLLEAPARGHEMLPPAEGHDESEAGPA